MNEKERYINPKRDYTQNLCNYRLQMCLARFSRFEWRYWRNSRSAAAVAAIVQWKEKKKKKTETHREK